MPALNFCIDDETDARRLEGGPVGAYRRRRRRDPGIDWVLLMGLTIFAIIGRVVFG